MSLFLILDILSPYCAVKSHIWRSFDLRISFLTCAVETAILVHPVAVVAVFLISMRNVMYSIKNKIAFTATTATYVLR